MKCSDGNSKAEDISEDHSVELLTNLKQNLYSLVSKKTHDKPKNGFILSLMGQKDHNNDHFTSTNYSELRCQSLPDCVEKLDVSTSTAKRKECDKSHLIETPQISMTSESWFKTWPERCDKQRSTETSPVTTPTKTENTQSKLHCDNFGQNSKNRVTLNEALKNISLAYSPVTKQLHLLEKTNNTCIDISDLENNDLKCLTKTNEVIVCNGSKKTGHRRTEAGSFSSTISSISEPSSNGSLLSNDDRSLSSFEIPSSKIRKKSLTNFFSK